MKQYSCIQLFNDALSQMEGIQSLILIGSFGRNQAKPNSDIDYQVLVDKEFNDKQFLAQVENAFQEELKYHIYLNQKRKWCFYVGNDYLHLEVFICYDKKELDIFYLGSEINQANQAIIFDKTQELAAYLDSITINKKNNLVKDTQQKLANFIVIFQNYFEGLSYAHARSDGYKFNVIFSHALNTLVRMIYLYEGTEKYEYMPPNFLTDYSYPLGLGIEKLGTMDLRLANEQKRKLLDLFLCYLPKVIEKFNLSFSFEEISKFLQNIYQRDYFWNFRDIAKFNPFFKKGLIFRTSTLSLFPKEQDFQAFLQAKNITQIIDLRAEREVLENSYSAENQRLFKYIHAPFDPWAQSIAFQNTYNTGTNAEIAYRFFMLECQNSIKKVMESLAENEGATAIHCHAGKDRTGIIAIFLHLLAGADYATILQDYLASEMDTSEKLFQIVWVEIEKKGGIEEYLQSCNLSLAQIHHLKKKLL